MTDERIKELRRMSPASALTVLHLEALDDLEAERAKVKRIVEYCNAKLNDNGTHLREKAVCLEVKHLAETEDA